MINNLPVAENRPIEVFENRPIEQLVHSHGRGKWILDKELEELALKKYYTNGRGITFSDIVEEYRCRKDKSQRRLKNACIEKTDKNGKKFAILFRLDDKRTKPQQYFPTCIKARIIENKRKRQNRLIDPTGTNYNNKTVSSSSSNYPLCNAVEQQMVNYFLTQLSLLPYEQLNMHNIHMRVTIDKSHYEEIKLRPCSDKNKTKIQRELIDLREVVYKFNKNGSVEIEIGCSKNPFPIETTNDVNNFFVFLGQVKCILAIILNDPTQRIVPPVDNWILKSCDFNKDVELDNKNIGQLMGLNIQVKHMGEAFRLYVKNLEDRFALRGEKVMKVNQPITSFMNDSILNPLHLINNKFDEVLNIIEKRFDEINNRISRMEKLTSMG
ncbi:MAG TPA: hypothetical protein VLA74_03220 [Nitrososphaeraceae archaeon]|nr:hypothetical protein [Nitrososphaeraceae archaeon]